MRSVLIFIALLVGQLVNAQVTDMEFKVKGSAAAESPQIARAEIQKKVIEEAALQAITQYIGEKKMAAQKGAVNQVLKQSSKFIPYIKSGEIQTTAEGYEIEFLIRVSATDLRQILLRQGLLYENEGSWLVVPLVRFTDRIKNTQVNWWAENGEAVNTSTNMARKFENSMRSKFLSQGFFALKPVTFELAHLLPKNLRDSSLSSENLSKVGEVFKADLLIVGDVELYPSQKNRMGGQLHVKLTGIHRATGRTVGEVVRTVEIENLAKVWSQNSTLFDEATAELSQQIFETWRKGIFGAELVKIAVNGTLTPRELQNFKTWISENFRQVKTFKERKFSNGQIIFEADVTSGTEALAEKLKTAQSSEFSVRVSSVNSKEMDLDVTPRKK